SKRHLRSTSNLYSRCKLQPPSSVQRVKKRFSKILPLSITSSTSRIADGALGSRLGLGVGGGSGVGVGACSLRGGTIFGNFSSCRLRKSTSGDMCLRASANLVNRIGIFLSICLWWIGLEIYDNMLTICYQAPIPIA